MNGNYFSSALIIFSGSILLCICFSCIKEIPIDTLDFEKRIVVNGLICPDSTFNIHVSSSVAINDNIETIDNAHIEVYKNDIYIGTCSFSENGWYQFSQTPSAGQNYKIVVSAPGYTSVSASTSIPVQIPVDEFTCKVLEGNDFENGSQNTNVVVGFQDEINVENYYEIAFYSGDIKYYETLFGIRLSVSDASIQADGELNYSPKTYFFSDVLFSNNYKTVNLRNFGGSYEGANGSVTNSPLNIDFKMMSQEYYNFRRSWVIHVFNANTTNQTDDPINLLFLGDPVALYSNVSGGYGVFAGYNRSTKSATYLP